MAQLAESPDATLLQRRARRRLVGAIALVVLVVIVLPIVLDKEPSPVGRDLVIQIPSQEAGKFNTRVLPPAARGPSTVPASGAEGPGPNSTKAETSSLPAPTKPIAAAGPAAGPAVPAAKTGQDAVVEGKAPAQVDSGAAKDSAPSGKEPQGMAKDDSEAARARSVLEGKEAWVVRLGAYSSEANVKQLRDKLTAAGLKSYTETAKGPKGEQTRVRAGPFDSRLEAEQAQEKLKAAGVSPGTVGPR